MPSAYEGTDIISCLRSKYIIWRQPYIISRSDISLYCDGSNPYEKNTIKYENANKYRQMVQKSRKCYLCPCVILNGGDAKRMRSRSFAPIEEQNRGVLAPKGSTTEYCKSTRKPPKESFFPNLLTFFIARAILYIL